VIDGQLHPSVESAAVEAAIDTGVVVPRVGLRAMDRQRCPGDIFRLPVPLTVIELPAFSGCKQPCAKRTPYRLTATGVIGGMRVEVP
jgi:hypothetical protein